MHPLSRAFLSLARFWCTQERVCMNRADLCTQERLCTNQGRPLLSMGGMLMGYSFESRPNNHEIATVRLIMTIALSVNDAVYSTLNNKNKWVVVIYYWG